MRKDKLTAILVDDEPAAINYLQGIVDKMKMVEIIGCFTDPKDAVLKIILNKPDILFLDIQMPEMSGFDVVKQVNSENYAPHIIFTTAYDKFAIAAIKHAALDYFLKPVDPDGLRETVLKLLNRADHDKNAKLEKLLHQLQVGQPVKFNTSTGFIRIIQEDIIYLEADGNYCDIYQTHDRHDTVTTNMNQVNKLLNPAMFFRISRFNIINMKFLYKIERRNHSCILYEAGKKISLKISASNAKDLEQLIE